MKHDDFPRSRYCSGANASQSRATGRFPTQSLDFPYGAVLTASGRKDGKPLLAEMLIEGKDALNLTLLANDKTDTIHQTKTTPICSQ